mmetsp:Transcript_2500/g.3873  ORF Transcript_2500/g.3873 Transcript_2500/m.3873 type:complete len:225 (-) Transcript_2500:275-949(-)|eukprot:CAMPEP_0201522878 /NCGR_PEP_ID=MMETSP0161_2-20130828/18610_1 /ASSEMBLY_ACC=CAM_ASM_000251 /TAXON_ID=180227 /ORGANISM="Neoparamoeba aestuarina, Strain SoJaBio B1-5/56/2" /LENGTH=224 /DNA_ID=CAMNT_0047921837 /DNA_START=65 /DNA_END=739 /DNA_ORIENTATION=-
MADDYDYLFKIILVGDSGVGKSNLMSQFTSGEFSLDNRATIGVGFAARNVDIQGKRIKAQIWDTAGQERYKSINNAYYRGAYGALVVYDITKRKTFDAVPNWLSDVCKHASSDIPVVVTLVGNKNDLEHLRSVQLEEASAYAEQQKIGMMETSALSAQNVEEAFMNTIQRIFDNVKELGIPEQSRGLSQGDQDSKISLGQGAGGRQGGSSSSAQLNNANNNTCC